MKISYFYMEWSVICLQSQKVNISILVILDLNIVLENSCIQILPAYVCVNMQACKGCACNIQHGCLHKRL